MPKVDLNKLKSEIDDRKKERNINATPLKENVAPRDVFLHELKRSLDTGRESMSSNLIKRVDNATAIKNKEQAKFVVNETESHKPTPQPQRPARETSSLSTVEMSPERDEELFAEFDKRRKMTLAESLESVSKTPFVGSPMNNTISNISATLNEGLISENIKKQVNNYLAENLEPIFEEAIKSTILEMYAAERIQQVLKENKELIKTMVYETIREIQAKNKSKAY